MGLCTLIHCVTWRTYFQMQHTRVNRCFSAKLCLKYPSTTQYQAGWRFLSHVLHNKLHFRMLQTVPYSTLGFVDLWLLHQIKHTSAFGQTWLQGTGSEAWLRCMQYGQFLWLMLFHFLFWEDKNVHGWIGNSYLCSLTKIFLLRTFSYNSYARYSSISTSVCLRTAVTENKIALSTPYSPYV